jgi:hypothetical protein
MGSWDLLENGIWVWFPSKEHEPKPGEGRHGYSYEEITDPNRDPGTYEPHQHPQPQKLEVPPDVNIPTLAIENGWPPKLDGIPTKANSPEDGQAEVEPSLAPPSNDAYHILPASLRDAQQTIMNAVKLAVDDWDDLKAYVDRVKDYVFYRPADIPAVAHVKPTQEQLDAVSSLDNACLGGADAIKLVGVVVQYLDATGQIYVQADKDSFFPPG